MTHEAGQEHIHPEPKGFLKKYIFSMDHKVIGKQYLFTALFFLVVGGLFAMIIRWQLAYPKQEVPVISSIAKATFLVDSQGKVGGQEYAGLVTMHGTLMIFFVIIPILVGAFGNFLIPLHVGARDVAFPFINMLSYQFFFLASVTIICSFFVDKAVAAAGWTGYPPLSTSGIAGAGTYWGQIFWLLSLIFLGTSSILGGFNFMVTIVKMRAPGLGWSKLPLTTWAQFITSVFQLLATPVLAAALIMQLLDMTLGTNFFRPAGIQFGNENIREIGGGHPLLWQHIFWFYSHPAVYILVLPAMGMASDLMATFARKPIFGYTMMVASLCTIMGLGFMVWGHHMFLSGMNPYVGMAFMISTMMIALPSGVKVFNWLATIWGGSIRFTASMLFAVSFVAMFIIGGLSGLFMAATPVDIFIHDTYYIVAHFHYVVFGGTLMAVFGAIYFWFPKMFGRMMSEFWGKVHWFLTFVAFNLTFFPMHILGEAGHMRRIADPSEYPFLQPYLSWNVFISHSAWLLGASQLIFLLNFFLSMKFGKKSEINPWQSNTLEWTTASPVPYYNYERIPKVYNGPYEYNTSAANGRGDWLPQNEPPNGHGQGETKGGHGKH